MSEAQKPVTNSYRDNWDALYGKKVDNSEVAQDFYPTPDLNAWDIRYHCYDAAGYEGNSLTFGYSPEGKLMSNHASHCSCNSLEWEPHETTKEELQNYYEGERDSKYFRPSEAELEELKKAVDGLR